MLLFIILLTHPFYIQGQFYVPFPSQQPTDIPMPSFDSQGEYTMPPMPSFDSQGEYTMPPIPSDIYIPDYGMPPLPTYDMQPMPSFNNPKPTILYPSQYPMPSHKTEPTPSMQMLRRTPTLTIQSTKRPIPSTIPPSPFTIPDIFTSFFPETTGTTIDPNISKDLQEQIRKQMEEAMRKQMKEMEEEMRKQMKENIKDIDYNGLKDALRNMDTTMDSNVPKEMKGIMEEMKDTIKDIMKDHVKETIRATKEEIKSLVVFEEDRLPKNITELQSFITNIYDSFQELNDLTTNITSSFLDMKDSLRIIGTLAIQKDETYIFENKNENFTIHSTYVDGRKKRIFTSDETGISIPILPFENQTLSVIAWSDNPYDKLSTKEIYSKVITIMLSDYQTGNETRVYNLDDVINITIPLSNIDIDKYVPACMYWDDIAYDWKYDGCQIQNVSSTDVICGCSHLTDFSVGISQSIPENNSQGFFSTISKSTYVGIGVGVACLIFGIMAFIVVKKFIFKKQVVDETKNTAIVSHSNPIHDENPTPPNYKEKISHGPISTVSIV